MPKANKMPVTTGDLNIQGNYTGLMSDIIIDGRIMYDNLKCTNLDEKWVKKQLKINNIHDIGEVFYAGLNAAGTLYVSRKTR